MNQLNQLTQRLFGENLAGWYGAPGRVPKANVSVWVEPFSQRRELHSPGTRLRATWSGTVITSAVRSSRADCVP